MSENSVYIITPPDMQLLESGPSVTALSTDPLFIQSVETVHEGLFKTVPINLYHPDGEVKEENLAWTLSVCKLSDNVFVDLDTINEIGLLTALMSDASLVLINRNNENPLITKLLNSIKEFTIYKSPEDYMDMVVAQYV